MLSRSPCWGQQVHSVVPKATDVCVLVYMGNTFFCKPVTGLLPVWITYLLRTLQPRVRCVWVSVKKTSFYCVFASVYNMCASALLRACVHCSLQMMINLHSRSSHTDIALVYLPRLVFVIWALVCKSSLSAQTSHRCCMPHTRRALAGSPHSKMADQQLAVWFTSPWREQQNVEEYSSLYKYIMIQWAQWTVQVFRDVFSCIVGAR